MNLHAAAFEAGLLRMEATAARCAAESGAGRTLAAASAEGMPRGGRVSRGSAASMQISAGAGVEDPAGSVSVGGPAISMRTGASVGPEDPAGIDAGGAASISSAGPAADAELAIVSASESELWIGYSGSCSRIAVLLVRCAEGEPDGDRDGVARTDT